MKRSRKIKTGALLLAVALGINLLSISAAADASTAQEKISPQLQSAMADLAEGEKLPVYIGTQDIDHEAVELHVQQETGLTIDSIQLDVQTMALDTVKATRLE